MNMHGNESAEQYQAKDILSLLLLFLFVKWKENSSRRTDVFEEGGRTVNRIDELNFAKLLIYNCIFI